MRRVKITALQGTNFVYSPPKPQTFQVWRASGAPEAVEASASSPLVLRPFDVVEIADSDDFLDHLIATGQAEAAVNESIPSVHIEGETHAE